MDWNVTLSLGIIFAAALMGGVLASKVHIPKVTAYLLVGLLLGPGLLGALATYLAENWLVFQGFETAIEAFHGTDGHGGHLEQLQPLSDMAIALVLFNMGCHFTLKLVRRLRRRLSVLSTAELSITFVSVSLGLLVLGTSWQLAVLFGALALATAPATTILVLKENQSEGPITEYTTALVAINNLAAIIIFELVFLIVATAGGGHESPGHAVIELIRGLFVAAILGIAVGMMASYFCALLARSRWLVLMMALSASLLGVCVLLDVPYMLAFLAMGTTVANSSDTVDEISGVLGNITSLMCVVFFVISGTHMDLGALFAVGALGAAYIGLRSFGKYIGIFLFAEPHRDGPQTKHWLGAAMLSQAGAAIVLSSLAVERDPELGIPLQTVILGTIVFFELVGPILVRQAVIRGAEVPVDLAIHHTTTTMGDELRTIRNRVMVALGRDPWKKKTPESVSVSDLMRPSNKGISPSDTFDEIVNWIEHSHDNIFPVVTKTGELVGVIIYSDVRDNLFDPDLGLLVRASDLAIMPKTLLCPEDTLAKAWDYFRAGNDDEIPVVTNLEDRQLVGMVRRKDLLSLFRHKLPSINQRTPPYSG